MTDKEKRTIDLELYNLLKDVIRTRIAVDPFDELGFTFDTHRKTKEIYEVKITKKRIMSKEKPFEDIVPVQNIKVGYFDKEEYLKVIDKQEKQIEAQAYQIMALQSRIEILEKAEKEAYKKGYDDGYDKGYDFWTDNRYEDDEKGEKE